MLQLCKGEVGYIGGKSETETETESNSDNWDSVSCMTKYVPERLSPQGSLHLSVTLLDRLSFTVHIFIHCSVLPDSIELPPDCFPVGHSRVAAVAITL